ncbi:unnamed protein product [Hermetia illucens]|uniref:Nuclear pore membrane glycoprotein 210 n=1 Tax=Hermetia illucens TaxID=343691 RepID=A0A7R8UCA6_HERIL|nr:unnamed protein product [Hermetia illucens]
MQKLLLFCAFLMLGGGTATKLNYPRVLLPIFDKISINFTLEVIEQGCFKWDTSRHDLIQITPVYDTFDGECSSKAVVTVLTREKRRNTAIVLAEELRTGDTLRCDVILDVIDKLGVLTTTRELFLEEAPETFELWAQDSQGNAFTTLEGVEFTWAISSVNGYNSDQSWQQVLRFLTFTESNYHEVPKSLEKFEAQGIKGYMVLLEGSNTGTARVTVRMPYPEYSHVPTIEVNIMVLANIILDPTDAHILMGDTINFRILQLKQGKLHEITLNSQYYLEIEDERIAEITGNKATGLRLGRSVVRLRDRNVPSDGGFNQDGESLKSSAPRATITVSTASKITINLLPHYNWVTIEGEKHEIAIDLYTHDDQKIYLGPRYNVESTFQESLFYVLQKSQNGSRIYGEAVRHGSTPVLGSFEKLTAKAELQIYKELTLTPRRVVLPFDPSNSRRQRIRFIATGGDESYVWSSQNSKLISISQSGIAETRIDPNTEIPTEYLLDEDKNIVTKHTTVRVALARNTKIVRTAEVFFLPPVKLSIKKYNFETALRDYVKIHLSLYSFVNSSYVPFTNCDNLQFDLEFSSQIFQLDTKKEPIEGELAKDACTILYLKGTSLGTTQLKISYKFMDKVLRDEATLVVFEKLTILDPVLNEVILPIGSSRNVIYNNGPQKLFNIEAELQNRVDFDKQIVDITKIESDTSKSLLAYNILCRKVGETVLDLEMFNSIPKQSFEPFYSKYVTKIYCVKPRFINLYTTEILRQSCPIEMKNSLMHVKNRAENLDIEIEVLDSKNRKLMNISSLVIEWEFAQGNEAYHTNAIHYRQTEEEFIEGIRVPARDFLVTAIGDVTASFKVKASVTKYDLPLLKSFSITPEKPFFGIEKLKDGSIVQPVIENEIKFMAVNSTLLDRDSISIFLGRNKPERVSIAQGSGFYEIKLSEPGIISVEFDPKSREIIIFPHQIGNVQLELIDRCLMTEAAHLTVSVVSIGSIQCVMPDRVEKGKSIEAIIRLYDSNDNLMKIDNANLQIYELYENIFNSAIVSVRLGEQSNLDLGEIRYYVNGLELGETKIIFNSGYGDRAMAIASDPVTVQVFPPLRLYPRNSTLIVSSSLQIYSHGGPHPDISIVYSVENSNIVSMDSAVILAKKLGTTRITGRCVGVNPIDGRQIIFSEDSIEVTVIPLEKVQVRTPLVRIKTGAVMPAFIWGVPDISPVILGTMESIRIIWSTNQPDVVDIFGIFSDAGIEYTEHDLISVRVKALNPGKARIQASIILPGGQRLSSSVEVVVFKMLEIEAPKHINQDTILIPPRSTIQLKANLDDVVYKLSSESNGIVRVSSDGNVKSGDTLGRDLIIAKTFDQTLPIDVEVKNIQYILATLLYPSVKLRQIEQKIPSGMNMILKISLHDNLGNEFSHNIEDVNGIKYELSHKDVVDVQIGNNLTVSINLPRETITMIAISLKDSAGVKHAEDFIKVSVAESKNIFPTKTIFSVGDIICFDSPLTSATFWSSSDERIVSIDRHTGVARVLGNRFKSGEKIAISNGDKSGSFLKYDIEVREADKIEFFKSYDIFSGNSYRGHLVLRNHLQVDKFSNLIARNVSKCSNFIDKVPVKFFTCKISSKEPLGVQVIDNFKVTSLFDKNVGTYACEIVLITSQLDILSVVKSNEVNIELEAQLPNGLSDIVTLKIVPAIKVTPDAISVDQITQQGIVVTGLDKVLQKVEVKPSDASVLEVIPQAKAHGSLQYKVKLINELPTDEQLFVQVHSPLTLQDIQVPIEETNSVMKCSTRPFNNASTFLINIVSHIGVIISVIVLILTIYVWFFCSSQRKAEVNDSAFAKSFKSTSKSPITSVSGSPQLTPRGPSYPNSPYYGNQSSGSQNISSGNESPVYGISHSLDMTRN